MTQIEVVGAVVVRDGLVLCAQRATGPLAGRWEFPGGKVEPGEDPRAALRRELTEELGIEAEVGGIVEVTFHEYVIDPSAGAKKAVLLLFFEATRTASSPAPRALDVAAFRWAGKAELDPEAFPPADVAVLLKVAARLQGCE